MQEKTTTGATLSEAVKGITNNAIEPTTKQPIMWSLKQASIETGVKYCTLRLWVKKGFVPAVRLGVGNNGKILLNREGLLRYLSTATLRGSSPPDNYNEVKGGIRVLGGTYHE